MNFYSDVNNIISLVIAGRSHLREVVKGRSPS